MLNRLVAVAAALVVFVGFANAGEVTGKIKETADGKIVITLEDGTDKELKTNDKTTVKSPRKMSVSDLKKGMTVTVTEKDGTAEVIELKRPAGGKKRDKVAPAIDRVKPVEKN